MVGITQKCIVISNYIIKELNKVNKGKTLQEYIIIKKRIQRILYICDIEYMKINNGQPLFEDNFYAWTSGPVIPYIYYTFLPYQSKKIEPGNINEQLKLTNKEKNIIDKVLKETKELDIVELTNITNINNGPWQQIYNKSNSNYNQTIPKEETYNFYKNKKLFIQSTNKDIESNLKSTDFKIKYSNNNILKKDKKLTRKLRLIK